MKTKVINKFKQVFFCMVLMASVMGVSVPSWAGNLSVGASTLVQLAVGDEAAEPIIVIRDRDTTGVSDTQSVNCFNANDATWELRLERANPHFKDMLAMAMAAHLMNKPFSISTREESCNIQNFGLRPNSLN